MAGGKAWLLGSDAEDFPESEVDGAVVCGSAGEVANDPSLGDSWLDVTAIDNSRHRALGVPLDTSSRDRTRDILPLRRLQSPTLGRMPVSIDTAGIVEPANR